MHNLTVYLLISAALFLLGLLAIMTRKNAVSVLMGIELMLNSAGLNFVAFSRGPPICSPCRYLWSVAPYNISCARVTRSGAVQ